MVKAAQVKLLRSSTVCPGKYMILIGGETGDVKASMREGLAHGGAAVVDQLLLPNAHEQLFPAISMTNRIERPGAVGVLEFYSIASAIEAADVAVKAADVTLIEIRTGYAVGGKGFVTLTGDVGAVKAAVARGGEGPAAARGERGHPAAGPGAAAHAAVRGDAA